MSKDFLKTSDQNIDPLKTSGSLIVRDLSGKIYFWSSSAEEKYGWSPREAMGNVSHDILNTVFPQPLDVINFELLNKGVWKGELIHTRVDGSRVKVQSSWHLYRDEQGMLCTVLEVNDNFFTIQPGNAHLANNFLRRLKQYSIFLGSKRRWWLTPIILCILIFFALINWTTPFSSLLDQEEDHELTNSTD